MGAKQSGPAAANGRTRAYSGSDLPSSSSGGTNGTAGGGGSSGARAAAAGRFPAQVPGAHQPSGSGGAAAASAAPRSRSLGGAVGSVASAARAAQSSFSIPNSSSGPYGSQDSVHSSPEDGSGGGGGRDRPAGGGPGGPRLVIGSLPAHLSPHMFGGFKCPVCSKFVPSDEMDLHLVMCLTKPRITYNDEKPRPREAGCLGLMEAPPPGSLLLSHHAGPCPCPALSAERAKVKTRDPFSSSGSGCLCFPEGRSPRPKMKKAALLPLTADYHVVDLRLNSFIFEKTLVLKNFN
ncbi:E3 ubiquitin-protein ligase ZNRF2 isoform X1 [Mustela lutreola]|uniref:E3 ubiquitin-protein ligase ZNRF2 isoform X1 n=1 Tax=Mustela lutreola TaxID=9666 RepID=UPI00279713DC|nr:E3 ubiquitin-protein ligase ZNRF2 isoform X1 [Mustela lutreola]